MKDKIAKLIDLKSIVTLLMNIAMVIMLFYNKEIDNGLMIHLMLPAEEYNLEEIVRRVGV